MTNLLHKIALLLVVSIFLLGTIQAVEAAPPFATQSTPQQVTGYVIETHAFAYQKANTSREFNFHIFNVSNGYPIYDTSTRNMGCVFHLYNQTGDHIFIQDPITTIEHKYDYSVSVPAQNFSMLGQYAYIVQCNSSNVGGAAEAAFEVTKNGEATQPYGKLIYSLTFMIILFVLAIVILWLSKFFASQIMVDPNNPTTIGKLNMYVKIIQPVFLFTAIYLIFIGFTMGMIGFENGTIFTQLGNMINSVIFIMSFAIRIILFVYILFLAYTLIMYIRYVKKFRARTFK